MKQNITLFYRILIYALGLFFMAVGVAFSVNSSLEVSPVNSLPYVISLILNTDMGICVTSVFSIYVLVQIIIKRSQFRLIDLTQLLFSALFGYFVDFAKWIVGDFILPGYIGQMTLLIISMLFVAVGLSLYLGVKLVNMPMEGMTLAISQCFPLIPFHKVKIIVDCSAVAVGITLSFLFLGRLQGIREGTVLSALLTGRLLPLAQKPILPIVRRVCFEKEI